MSIYSRNETFNYDEYVYTLLLVLMRQYYKTIGGELVFL